MKLISSLFLFLLFCPSIEANALDLLNMQEMATNNREVIKRYQTSLAKSGEEIRAARSDYYPSLDIGYKANNLDEASTTEHRQNSSFYGMATINIFQGFADHYLLESKKALHEVAAHKLKAIEQDVQLTVALRYLTVYERLASLRVAEDNLKTLQRLHLDGEQRLQVGLIGQNELLKIKVDLDNSDITLKKGEAELKKSIQLLAREIKHPLTLKELHFQDFETLPKLAKQDLCKTQMLNNRSELLALKGLSKSASMQIRAEQGSYYPRLDLVGSYSHYADDFINSEGEFSDEELRAQLLLSYKLFDGFARESAVAKAKLTVRELQYDIDELSSTLTTTLGNLFIDYQVSMENVAVAKEDIQHAEENLRITQLKYKQGLQRESDLLDAVTNLSRARYNEVSVIRTVFENAFRVQRMMENFPFHAPVQK